MGMDKNRQINNINPEHYRFGSIEVIEYIKSALGVDGCYNFCMGNAIKYISRAEHKGKQVEDLKKAIWYIDYAIDLISELKKSGEDFKKPVEAVPYINIPNITPTTVPGSDWTTISITNSCATCPNNPKNMPNDYVGDWPCQWCSHNPVKITCTSDANTNTIK